MAQPMVASERRARGFTLLGLLFLVAGLGVATAAIGVAWQMAGQREKERELLFVGQEFRQALESYRSMGSSGGRRLPDSLETLVSDKRFPFTVRHLRRIYRDPMTGKAEWGLERDPGGGIVGVYSLSEGEPLQRANFPEYLEGFAEAKNYREWIFRPPTPPDAGPGQNTTPAASSPKPASPSSPPAGNAPHLRSQK